MAKTRPILDPFDLFGCFKLQPLLYFNVPALVLVLAADESRPKIRCPAVESYSTPSQTIGGAGTAPPQFTFRMTCWQATSLQSLRFRYGPYRQIYLCYGLLIARFAYRPGYGVGFILRGVMALPKRTPEHRASWSSRVVKGIFA